MLRNDVAVAFDLLLEELEMAVETLNREGADVFIKGDYTVVREMSQQAEQLADMRTKVKELQRDWGRVFAGKMLATVRRQGGGRGALRERLGRGLRTPEEAFRIPVLRAIVELGGTAQVAQVLEHLDASMQTVLNEYDRQPLSSDPVEIRWRNTAQWCRNSLAREGLLAADSPRGVWSITAAGRAELERAPE